MGVYFLTTLASSDIGFVNVAGPAVIPSISRDLGKGRSATGYVKFSPVASSIGLLGFGNRELAVGAAYLFDYRGRRLSIDADYSDFRMKIDQTSVKGTTFTLGISAGL